MKTVYEGDVGTVFEFEFTDYDDDTKLEDPIDISSALVISCKLKDQAGNVIERPLQFVTDGTDGLAQYTLVAGDVPADSAGLWLAQGFVTLPAGSWHSKEERFRVMAPLS